MTPEEMECRMAWARAALVLEVHDYLVFGGQLRGCPVCRMNRDALEEGLRLLDLEWSAAQGRRR